MHGHRAQPEHSMQHSAGIIFPLMTPGKERAVKPMTTVHFHPLPTKLWHTITSLEQRCHGSFMGIGLGIGIIYRNTAPVWYNGLVPLSRRQCDRPLRMGEAGLNDSEGCTSSVPPPGRHEESRYKVHARKCVFD